MSKSRSPVNLAMPCVNHREASDDDVPRPAPVQFAAQGHQVRLRGGAGLQSRFAAIIRSISHASASSWERNPHTPLGTRIPKVCQLTTGFLDLHPIAEWIADAPFSHDLGGRILQAGTSVDGWTLVHCIITRPAAAPGNPRTGRASLFIPHGCAAWKSSRGDDGAVRRGEWVAGHPFRSRDLETCARNWFGERVFV